MKYFHKFEGFFKSVTKKKKLKKNAGPRNLELHKQQEIENMEGIASRAINLHGINNPVGVNLSDQGF